ncbi:MAG: hypothetical protein ACPHVZ_09160 [Psychrobacter sp.]
MTTIVNKRPPLRAAMLSVSLSSSLLLALGLTTLTSAQAAISLNENAKISPVTTANYCNDNADNNEPASRYTTFQSPRQRAIACMQLQLKEYQLASMNAEQQYFAYKAQAWLNYANHEDSINSTTAAGDYAFNDAQMILQALQEGQEDKLDLMTDIPETSALMRPDLWANISALKDSGGIASAPRELAFSEVSLVWAAADHCEHGFRSSGSHFRMADRWLEQAREAFVNANDSAASLAMQELAVSYYEQYKSLDPSDDVCRGQVLTPAMPAPISLSITDAATADRINIASTIPSTEPMVSY